MQAFMLGCFMAGLGAPSSSPAGCRAGHGAWTPSSSRLFVVVIGGLGSLEGALLGAIMVGVVREFGIAFFRRSSCRPLFHGGRGSPDSAAGLLGRA